MNHLRASVWVLLVLVAGVLYAQTPRAVIVGPKETISGDIVVLDASQSQGTKFMWRMLESDKSFFGKPTDMQIAFSAGVREARTFHFVLVAVGLNANGGPEMDVAFHDLVVTPLYPGPDPKPPNVQPPVTPPTVTPPVNPTRPVARALILLESGEESPERAKLELLLRRDKTLSQKVLLLDPNSETGEAKPVKLVLEAIEYLSKKPTTEDKALPRVFALTAEGSFVGDCPLPADFDALVKQLQAWGL